MCVMKASLWVHNKKHKKIIRLNFVQRLFELGIYVGTW
jgi:hypothetical protein